MKICIISPRHVSYNPRVVKEADALDEAGHHVTVIAIRSHSHQTFLDEQLMSSRSWRLLTFNYRKQNREWLQWLVTGVRQKFFYFLSKRLRYLPIVERAAVRELDEMTRLAKKVPADLYIAHHAEALPIARKAARAKGVAFGFDAEDFHSGMDGINVPRGIWAHQKSEGETVQMLLKWHSQQPRSVHIENIVAIEREYLPQCSKLTAASPLIALAYTVKYHLKMPIKVINNVFPFEDCDRIERARRRTDCGRVVRLYWYSQIIGPGRGLECAVKALKYLPENVQLHLRGDLLPGYDHELGRLARESGCRHRLHLHPAIPPEELVREAAKFDVGLALETNVELNRLLCITNKTFTYLNAGLPVVLTSTPAQRQLANLLGGCAVPCEIDDPKGVALGIEDLLNRKIEALRLEARKLARERHSWEREKTVPS